MSFAKGYVKRFVIPFDAKAKINLNELDNRMAAETGSEFEAAFDGGHILPGKYEAILETYVNAHYPDVSPQRREGIKQWLKGVIHMKSREFDGEFANFQLKFVQKENQRETPLTVASPRGSTKEKMFTHQGQSPSYTSLQFRNFILDGKEYFFPAAENKDQPVVRERVNDDKHRMPADIAFNITVTPVFDEKDVVVGSAVELRCETPNPHVARYFVEERIISVDGWISFEEEENTKEYVQAFRELLAWQVNHTNATQMDVVIGRACNSEIAPNIKSDTVQQACPTYCKFQGDILPPALLRLISSESVNYYLDRYGAMRGINKLTNDIVNFIEQYIAEDIIKEDKGNIFSKFPDASHQEKVKQLVAAISVKVYEILVKDVGEAEIFDPLVQAKRAVAILITNVNKKLEERAEAERTAVGDMVGGVLYGNYTPTQLVTAIRFWSKDEAATVQKVVAAFTDVLPPIVEISRVDDFSAQAANFFIFLAKADLFFNPGFKSYIADVQANSAAFAAVQRKLLAKTSNNLPQISQIADNKEVLNEFVNLIVMLSQVNLLADPKFKHYLTVVRAEPDVRLAVRKKLGEKPIKSERIIVFLEMSIATEKNKIKYFLGRYNKLLEAIAKLKQEQANGASYDKLYPRLLNISNALKCKIPVPILEQKEAVVSDRIEVDTSKSYKSYDMTEAFNPFEEEKAPLLSAEQRKSSAPKVEKRQPSWAELYRDIPRPPYALRLLNSKLMEHFAHRSDLVSKYVGEKKAAFNRADDVLRLMEFCENCETKQNKKVRKIIEKHQNAWGDLKQTIRSDIESTGAIRVQRKEAVPPPTPTSSGIGRAFLRGVVYVGLSIAAAVLFPPAILVPPVFAYFYEKNRKQKAERQFVDINYTNEETGYSLLTTGAGILAKKIPPASHEVHARQPVKEEEVERAGTDQKELVVLKSAQAAKESGKTILHSRVASKLRKILSKSIAFEPEILPKEVSSENEKTMLRP